MQHVLIVNTANRRVCRRFLVDRDGPAEATAHLAALSREEGDTGEPIYNPVTHELQAGPVEFVRGVCEV